MTAGSPPNTGQVGIGIDVKEDSRNNAYTKVWIFVAATELNKPILLFFVPPHQLSLADDRS